MWEATAKVRKQTVTENVFNIIFPLNACDEGGEGVASVNTWVGGILEVWRDGRARGPRGPFTQNTVNGGERGGGG